MFPDPNNEKLLAEFNKTKAKRAKPRKIETKEQAALVEWAQLTVIGGFRIGDYLTHVPNEGKRGPVAAKEFKELGGSTGYPDLILDIPAHGYHGLRIEMKSPKEYRSKVSQAQQEWIDRLNQVGIKAVVCYGLDEAIQAITRYMKGTL